MKKKKKSAKEKDKETADKNKKDPPPPLTAIKKNQILSALQRRDVWPDPAIFMTTMFEMVSHVSVIAASYWRT